MWGCSAKDKLRCGAYTSKQRRLLVVPPPVRRVSLFHLWRDEPQVFSSHLRRHECHPILKTTLLQMWDQMWDVLRSILASFHNKVLGPLHPPGLLPRRDRLEEDLTDISSSSSSLKPYFFSSRREKTLRDGEKKRRAGSESHDRQRCTEPHDGWWRVTTSGTRKVYLRRREEDTTETLLRAIARLAHTCTPRMSALRFRREISPRRDFSHRRKARSSEVVKSTGSDGDQNGVEAEGPGKIQEDCRLQESRGQQQRVEEDCGLGDVLRLKVDLASARRVMRERRLDERRQKSDDVSATAAPVPIETPTSLCVSATISLILVPSERVSAHRKRKKENVTTYTVTNKENLGTRPILSPSRPTLPPTLTASKSGDGVRRGPLLKLLNTVTFADGENSSEHSVRRDTDLGSDSERRKPIVPGAKEYRDALALELSDDDEGFVARRVIDSEESRDDEGRGFCGRVERSKSDEHNRVPFACPLLGERARDVALASTVGGVLLVDEVLVANEDLEVHASEDDGGRKAPSRDLLRPQELDDGRRRRRRVGLAKGPESDRDRVRRALLDLGDDLEDGIG